MKALLVLGVLSAGLVLGAAPQTAEACGRCRGGYNSYGYGATNFYGQPGSTLTNYGSGFGWGGGYQPYYSSNYAAYRPYIGTPANNYGWGYPGYSYMGTGMSYGYGYPSYAYGMWGN